MHPGHHQGLNRRRAGRVAVIQHLAPTTQAHPLHVHHRENENDLITAGRTQPGLHARLAALPWRQIPVAHQTVAVTNAS